MPTAQYVEINGQFYSPKHPKAKGQAGAQPLGRLDTAEPQPNQICPLDRKLSAQPGRKRGVVVCVTFVVFLNHRSDADNFGHSQLKKLRDSIAKSLAVDDGDARIKWEYPEPVVTRGATGVNVLISIME